MNVKICKKHKMHKFMLISFEFQVSQSRESFCYVLKCIFMSILRTECNQICFNMLFTLCANKMDVRMIEIYLIVSSPFRATHHFILRCNLDEATLLVCCVILTVSMTILLIHRRAPQSTTSIDLGEGKPWKLSLNLR